MLVFSKMDSVTECTQLVYNRIQHLEPEFTRNVIGYLLQQGHSAEELAQLAYGPDDFIQEVIHKAKANLQQLAIKPVVLVPSISPSLNADNSPVSDFAPQFTSFSHMSSPNSTTFGDAGSYWDRQLINKHGLDSMSLGFSNPVNQLNNQTWLLGKENQEDCISSGMSRLCYGDAEWSNLHMREGPRFSGLRKYPVKTCHFFNKGGCKHGSNCRYLHVDAMSDTVFDPNRNGFANEDQVISPGSLQELELEIVDILRSTRGSPVSIASLPMIYYDKYGKFLQAEGYLTESQRHGKAGYSLTRLLARLRNSIRLIDRPHGQHAIILAEDAPRYLENRNDRNDPGPIVHGSRQIYLTFPAESTFSEDEVKNYFNTFGKVEDVRMPCQQQRMFGFVTFASADTVRTILAKGNPHFVCGCRVLVKPYREKAKPLERKYSERRDSLPYHLKYSTGIDLDYPLLTRGFESPRMLRKQLMEQQARALEFERMHLAQLNLVQKTLANQSQTGYSNDGLHFPENVDHANFPSAEVFNHIINNVLDDGSTSDEKEGDTSNNSAPESQALALPANPIASTVNSISTDI